VGRGRRPWQLGERRCLPSWGPWASVGLGLKYLRDAGPIMCRWLKRFAQGRRCHGAPGPRSLLPPSSFLVLASSCHLPYCCPLLPMLSRMRDCAFLSVYATLVFGCRQTFPFVDSSGGPWRAAYAFAAPAFTKDYKLGRDISHGGLSMCDPLPCNRCRSSSDRCSQIPFVERS